MAKGKGVRARQKEKRVKAKRDMKEKQQAMYALWRDEGKNKKSKRFIKSNKGSNRLSVSKITRLVPCVINGVMVLASRRVHGGTRCKNIGCKRCSPVWEQRSYGLKEK